VTVSRKQAEGHRWQDTTRHSSAAALDAALADQRAPRYSIGQAAELLGVRPWFLRRLDALDVVKPSRSEGDQRRYSREQLAQIAAAKDLMRDGVSALGVRYVLELQARVAHLEEELAKAKGAPRRGVPRRLEGRRTGSSEPAKGQRQREDAAPSAKAAPLG
jgi:MerR family transcriptional regulator/heat shock protein HspR